MPSREPAICRRVMPVPALSRLGDNGRAGRRKPDAGRPNSPRPYALRLLLAQCIARVPEHPCTWAPDSEGGNASSPLAAHFQLRPDPLAR
ncbi:MAG: hypothetical protein AB1635_11495 [Acidobacteriota bacterium]